MKNFQHQHPLEESLQKMIIFAYILYIIYVMCTQVWKILVWIYPLDALKYKFVFPLPIRYYKSMIKKFMYIKSYFPLTFLTSKIEIHFYKKKDFLFKEEKNPMEAFSSPSRKVLSLCKVKCRYLILFSHKIPRKTIKQISSHSFLNSMSETDLCRPQNTAEWVLKSSWGQCFTSVSVLMVFFSAQDWK